MIITFDSKKNRKNHSTGNRQPSNDPTTRFARQTSPEKPLLMSNMTNPHKPRDPEPNSNNPGDDLVIKVMDGTFETNKLIRRSRRGCITCKFRKKKCDEAKPVCAACRRLSKKCVYADPDSMSLEEIDQLKSMVLQTESNLKLRRRKKSFGNPFFPELSPITGPQAIPLDNSSTNNSKTIIDHYMESHPISNVQPISNAKIEEELELESDDEEQALVKSPASSPDFLAYLKELSQEFSLANQDFYKPGGEEPLDPLSPEFLTQQLVSANPSSPNFNFAQLLTNLRSPSPMANPSILGEFSQNASGLYDYYVNVLTPTISVAPRLYRISENYYQKVFLPLAHKDHGIMNSVLAWACFHRGRPQDLIEGAKYCKSALDHYHSIKITDRESVINRLALLLILVGVHICKGDVKTWSTYLDWGFKILSNNGGINEYGGNKQEFWLISNFAYHDVLSSGNIDRGTYFPNTQYNELFHSDLASGISNPLIGISKGLISIIGDISSLTFETKTKLADLDDELNAQNISKSPEINISGDLEEEAENESEISSHTKKNQVLLAVKEKAQEIEHRIDQAKPNPDDLISLTDEEFEWQITLFETFKLSVKLYLRQSIFKCNPSTLESQLLNNDLIKCLDIILGTPVESVLVFPVFICGIHCVSKTDRLQMTKRIDSFIKTYGPWSVVRAKEVIERIWVRNPDGDKVIDWHGILKELGWEINFA